MVGKIVVFRSGNEEYGIPIQYIVSIEKMESITPVPVLPEYAKGIVEIRAELVPIIDLEYIFYHRFMKIDDSIRLVVIHAAKLAIGLLVNEAKEIIEISSEAIKQVGLIDSQKTSYISGIASLANHRLITIIDPEILMDSLDGISEIQDYMESHC